VNVAVTSRTVCFVKLKSLIAVGRARDSFLSLRGIIRFKFGYLLRGKVGQVAFVFIPLQVVDIGVAPRTISTGVDKRVCRDNGFLHKIKLIS
jgi:hypothetical protein